MTESFSLEGLTATVIPSLFAVGVEGDGQVEKYW